MTERYALVAYVGVLNDDNAKVGIPLYVKIKGEISAEQENLTKETAKHLVRQYQKQITDYFQKLKNGGIKNDQNQIPS